MPENKPAGINRNARLWLAVGGALILVYVLAIAWAGVPTSIQTNPAKVAGLTHEITDYDLPAGYTERAATTIAGVTTLLIDDQDEMNTIWLVPGSAADGMTPDTELRQGITFPKYRNISWQATGILTESIRGQSIAVTTYSGSGSANDTYTAWAAAFQGKNGPAILVITGPQSTWSDATAQAFIASMR